MSTEVERRLEIKMAMPDSASLPLEELILLDPNLFSTRYPLRWVNNIYFDDHALTCYFDNIEGQPRRCKVRYRWYGEYSEHSTGRLELKEKIGRLTQKEHVLLPERIKTIEELPSVLEHSLQQTERHKMYSLLCKFHIPVLINRYQRKYYESACSRIRITVDQLLSFQPHSSTISSRNEISAPIKIIEFKAAAENEGLLKSVISRFPLRITKSSKYVTGIQALHGESILSR